VWSVAFSPDGKALASGSEDKTVILWSLVGRRRTAEPLEGHRHSVMSVTFSPDGKTLASGSADSTAILWDVKSRQRIGEPLATGTFVTSVALSPDGKTLASGGPWGPIILWDVDPKSWVAKAKLIANRGLTPVERQHYLHTGENQGQSHIQ
jgi:WD40 repeat protein